MSRGSGVLLVLQLGRVLTGQLDEGDLVMVKESEEQAEFEALQAELARRDASWSGAPAASNDTPTQPRP